MNSNELFQLKIFSAINEKYDGKNLVISPLSIYQVLCLAANGANNKSQKEMISTLSGKSIEELNEINKKILIIARTLSTVNIANAVMSRFDPLENFKQICTLYDSTVEKLISVEQVNDWCKKKTKGKIPEIIKSIQGMEMILLNAIYFHGNWLNDFPKRSTQQLDFKNFGTTPKKVDMMRKIEKENYYESEGVQAIRLDYRDDNMFALILLPPENKNINDFLKSFNNESLQNIKSNFQRVKVDLFLPKFKIEFSDSLKGYLLALGMSSLFSSDADFTNMTENKVFIGDVIHKTYLSVDEKGTEAAAITAMPVCGCSLFNPPPEKIYEMNVNRPFLFMLLNDRLPKGNEVVFIGKIEGL